MVDKINNINFINKVLTTNEQVIFNNLNNERRKVEFLAGRFACKEAYSKAMKVGIGKIDFLDFEVLKDENNAPISNIKNTEISISHDKDYVIAVVLVGEEYE